MKVQDILTLKNTDAISIAPTATIGDLCRLLRDRHIGAATVSSDGGKIEGVISERDVAYGLVTHGAALHTLPVSALMTRTVITCAPTDRVATVASTMLSRKIRHIPVEQNGRFIGMVSIRDVLSLRVNDLQQETAQLRMFVTEIDRPLQDRE